MESKTVNALAKHNAPSTIRQAILNSKSPELASAKARLETLLIDSLSDVVIKHQENEQVRGDWTPPYSISHLMLAYAGNGVVHNV